MVQLRTPDPDILMQPPQAIEAEQAVIGGLLLDNNAIDRVDFLRPGDFYSARHRLLFEAISRMLAAGKPADALTAAETLGEKLEEVGGQAYIGSLALNTPSAANIRRYAEIVRNAGIRRQLIAASRETIDECLQPGAPEPREIAERAESRVLAVLGDELFDSEIEYGALLRETVGRTEDMRNGKREAVTETGFAKLDALLCGGLQSGDLIILAARPSVGKTALALNIAAHVAHRGRPAFFSLEMDRRQIAQRGLAMAAQIPLDSIRSGSLTGDELNHLADVAIDQSHSRILLDDRGAIGLAYIRARCRRWKRQGGLSLVVVDYLQLMRGEGSNREQEVSSISRGLKALAKDLRVPVLALCQLSRALEGRIDKRPQLYDLRESGAIEQDADAVLMLYRDDLQVADSQNAGLAEVLIRKQRNGPLGVVTLEYDAPLCTFRSTDARFTSTVEPIRQPRGFRLETNHDGKAAAAGVDR